VHSQLVAGSLLPVYADLSLVPTHAAANPESCPSAAALVSNGMTPPPVQNLVHAEKAPQTIIHSYLQMTVVWQSVKASSLENSVHYK
jgi:hypothetical protein